MVLLSLIENRCHPLLSKKQKQGTEMCQDPACSLSCPLGMTAETLHYCSLMQGLQIAELTLFSPVVSL